MKPIGHWLNRADKALTRAMNGVLSEFGLTRLDWQVLNVIRDTTPEATDSAVLSALAAHADVRTLTASVDAVLSGGWATRTAPHRLALTPDGRRRLAAVTERVQAFRDLSMTGISAAEYRTAPRPATHDPQRRDRRLARHRHSGTGVDARAHGGGSFRPPPPRRPAHEV
ncbi:MarR family winged helix-turn-helix transcriptional regulator [Streptomyces sp. NPDC050743]|uniref:MarR family winged helix-turn-helix transcriptional regulator n=1 Tax=Streptomyces sp. NPDC050743 TaxID=3365634 RepID=UPI0037AAAC9A